jgi:hypothetical protein
VLLAPTLFESRPGRESIVNFRTLACCGFIVGLFVAGRTFAGDIYRLTSADGKTSYKANFGRGKRVQLITAFDPRSKKFVNLSYPADKPRPEPVGRIWDHASGRMLSLFKFPDVEQPLPEIPSVKDLKYFPLTDSDRFDVKLVGAFD